jgi:serine/threonine protein kinase
LPDPIERLPEMQPGQLLADRYTVLQLLGRGATSVVYKASDKLANEIVALKVIRQFTPGSDRALEGFRRELAVSRKLTHPNVVRIYDIGMDGRVFYIVMEYIDGQSLAELLAGRGRIDPPEFYAMFQQFGEALRWIHQRNIVHRDVKPSNVMFTHSRVLKVTDFGIARELGGDASTTRIGTPGYASPEQILGQKLTFASDIYSSGAMFFELLTATRPLAKRSLAEQCTDPPPSLGQVRPELPALLCQAVERCMQPDPAKRFQTVDELVAEMARAQAVKSDAPAVSKELSSSLQETRVDVQPVSPAIPSSADLPPGTPVPIPRPNVKMALAALAFIIVVGGVAVGWRMMNRQGTPAAPKRVDAPATPPQSTPTSPVAGADQVKTLQTASGTMVLVPKDQYPLGEPAAPVTLGPFYIDKYEVTNGPYKKFCAGPGRTCPPAPSWDADYAAKELRPAIGVTWNDADAYCKSVGKRLPSSTEWEAAARGSDQRKYPWGNWMVPGLSNLAGGSPPEHTADVGSFPVDLSPFGAADMAGNTREWVNDDAPNGQKTVRGGSYDFPADQFSITWKGARSPVADPAIPWPVGFRCAADPDAASKLQTSP